MCQIGLSSPKLHQSLHMIPHSKEMQNLQKNYTFMFSVHLVGGKREGTEFPVPMRIPKFQNYGPIDVISFLTIIINSLILCGGMDGATSKEETRILW